MLSLSSDVGRALTGGHALPFALQRCAEGLVQHLDAVFARIWTLNEAGDTLELQASAGMYTHLDGPHGRVPFGQFKIGLIAQERKPHLTNAVVGDPRVGDQEWAVREGMVAFAGHPLIIEDRLIGVMAIFARHPLADVALDALAAIADQIAVGIDRQQVETKLREQTEALETIHRIGQSLSAELDLHKLVQTATDAATHLTGAEFGAFFYNVKNEQGESYTLYTISGADRDKFSQFPMPRNTDIFAPTFNGEGTVRSSDITADTRYGKNAPYYGMPAGHLPVTSYLAVSVVSRSGEVLGGLLFGHEKPGVFTARHEQIVEGIASQAGIAIDNARLFQQAQQEISVRKRAETALRASETQLQLVLDASPVLIAYVDSDHRYCFNNRAYADWLGLTSNQINGKHVSEVIGEAAYAQIKARLASALSGKTVAYDRAVLYHGVEPRYVHTTLVPDRGERGEIKGVVSVVSDITENKRQIDEQKREAERERFLGQLGESMRSTPDPTAILTAVSCAVGEYLQTSRCYFAEVDIKAETALIYEEYCRDVPSWAGLYPLSSFGAEVIADLKRGKIVAVTDTMTDPRTAPHYQSTYIPTQIRAYLAIPLMENGQWVSTLVVNNADAPRVWSPEEIALLETVTERTRMAQENARLWQAERERSEQLARAISEVHHRVKNSLQGVSALLEMQIPYDSDTLPAETVRESLNQIKTIALVHDLLARDQPIGKVNAGQVLTNLVELLATGMKTAERSTPIHVETEEAWIPTKAATALALAVNELVSNAEKHSRRYREQRRNHREDGESHDAIEVRLTKHNQEVHVVVQDCGPGFPPDFNPARHANIGLELVQTLVRHDLHGSISFSNRADAAVDHKENAARGGTSRNRLCRGRHLRIATHSPPRRRLPTSWRASAWSYAKTRGWW